MAEVGTVEYASMLAALSQPTRLRIVEVVAQGGAEGVPAGRIARAVHCPASTLSFHLKELSQSGLLQPTPDGRFVRYSIKPEGFVALATFIAGLPGLPAAVVADTPVRTSPGKRRAKQHGAKAGQHRKSEQREDQLSIFGD